MGVFFAAQIIAPIIAFICSTDFYLTFGVLMLSAGIATEMAFNLICIDVPFLTEAQYIFIWFAIPVFVA